MLVWKPVSNAAVIILVVTAFPLLESAISTGRAKNISSSLWSVSLQRFCFGQHQRAVRTCRWAIYLVSRHYARRNFWRRTSARDAACDAYPLQTIKPARHSQFSEFVHSSAAYLGFAPIIVERPLLGWGLDASGPFRGYRSSSDPYVSGRKRQSRSELTVAPAQLLDLVGAWTVRRDRFHVHRLELIRTTGTRRRTNGGVIVCVMAIYCVATA